MLRPFSLNLPWIIYIISTGEEESQRWVNDWSHKIPDIEVQERRMTAHFMEMKLIIIPPHSVFLGHDYVRHAVAAWSSTERLRYHMYLIPHADNFSNAGAFAWGWSFRKHEDPVTPVPEVLQILNVYKNDNGASNRNAGASDAGDEHKNSAGATDGNSTQKPVSFYQGDGMEHDYTEEGLDGDVKVDNGEDPDDGESVIEFPGADEIEER